MTAQLHQIGPTGHRERVQDKFLKMPDPSILPDYEFLELILMKSIPRLDVKPLAKELLRHFGSLSAVLTASETELTSFKHLKRSTVTLFKIILESNRRMLLDRLKEQPIFSHWDEVVDYCLLCLQNQRIENCMILYLDSKFRLLRRDILQTGTTDRVFLYPREILKDALITGATGIVVVHNHPSGSVEPSKADISLTTALYQVLQAGNILFMDHLIIGSGRHVFSFSQHGLLTPRPQATSDDVSDA